MAMCLLGTTIDIHSGGSDLAFPHHESEIAQAEGATGQGPFVRCWVHTAMVRHEGEKMSKSLGNLVMVDDLLKEWSADALRLYLAQHHYRAVWSHSLRELGQAGELARRLAAAATVRGGPREALDPAGIEDAFVEALDDDLDTPFAILQLRQLSEAILRAADAGRDVAAAQGALRSMGSVFGLRLDAGGPEPRVLEGWSDLLQEFE
jgi:L-cysteine:1D-myo-inositol 2-amino-2-deoxy-alpha-D-glucopyranoside ligase